MTIMLCEERKLEITHALLRPCIRASAVAAVELTAPSPTSPTVSAQCPSFFKEQV